MRLAAWVLGGLSVPPVAPPEPDVDTPAIELSWHGQPSCPDAVVVRERWQDALAGTGAHVRITAAVDRTSDDRWRLQLEAVGPAGHGTRELVADSCDALVDAGAVIVGMVARGSFGEPVATPPLEPPSASIEPAPAVAPVASAPQHVANVAVPRRAAIPGWSARVGGAFDVGLLPTFGATIHGDVGAAWKFARLFVGALHGVARTREHDEVAGRFSLTAGTIGAGPVLRRGALVLAGIVGAEIGAVRAEGARVQTTHLRRRLWVAADIGVELGWAFARDWVLGVAATAVVPMRRWEFAIGEDPLGAIGRVGGRFGIWLGCRRLARVRNPAAGGQR